MLRSPLAAAVSFGEALQFAFEPTDEALKRSSSAQQHIYLAQAPLLVAAAEQAQPLARLLADLPAEPPCCVVRAPLL